ncbi:MAG: molybdopterin-dependent oxidoreductase [Candidatus Bathyarchaeia archaeon]
MKPNKLPPGQREIDHLLKWNIEHPWIVPENPKIDLKNWILTIDGEIENPAKLTWQDLLNLPAVESKSDFHCVESWSVRNCNWYGVKFGTLAQIVKPNKNAKNVLFQCADGYTTSLDIEELLHDDVLLAYKLNREWLEEPLGRPLRLVVPHKYAYKSAMWIERISFMKTKELGFWEKRGYSDSADVWKNDRYASK